MKCSDARSPVSTRFVFLRSSIPFTHSRFAPDDGKCRADGPGAFASRAAFPRAASSRRETIGPPTFLGNPLCLCPALRPRRDGTRQAFTTRPRGPRSDHDEGSRVDGFRGSITRPGHSLSTLRRVGRPTTTQDSLSATGQVLPDGLSPAGFHRKVSATSSHPPFPSFVAQGPYLFDVDGNRYVDLVGSWGSAIVGHTHPAVVEAVCRAAKNGLSFGACCARRISSTYRSTGSCPLPPRARWPCTFEKATPSPPCSP